MRTSLQKNSKQQSNSSQNLSRNSSFLTKTVVKQTNNKSKNQQVFTQKTNSKQPLIRNTISNSNPQRTVKQVKTNMRNRNQLMIRPSPERIYVQYIASNTDNVFYEERKSVFLLSAINLFLRLLIYLWLFLGSTMWILSTIQGYKGTCPSNAYCGVYIHCYQGYQLIGQTCQVNKDIKQKAEYICQLTSDKLNKQYGDLQCGDQVDRLKEIPYTKLQKVYQEFGVESSLVRRQIIEYLSNKNNQIRLGISYFSSTGSIYAEVKKHSLTCSAVIYFSKGQFLYHLVFFSLAMAVFFWFYRRRMIMQLAQKRYNQFKLQINENGIVNISDAKKSAHLSINQIVWDQIQRLRYQQKQFGYYEQEDGCLYWCRI